MRYLILVLFALVFACTTQEIAGPEGAPGKVNVRNYEFEIFDKDINCLGWSAYVDVRIVGLKEDTDLVQVYRWRENGWQALPYSVPAMSNGSGIIETISVTYHYEDDVLSIDFYPSFYTKNVAYFPTGKYRAVIVEGENV